MPKQSICMIRLSLVYLFIAVLIGGLILSHKAIDIHPIIWGLLPMHFELAIWGWLVQFVMGTAYWMFPKKLEGERRGPVLPAWLMVTLFNTGLILLSGSTLITESTLPAVSGRVLIGLSIIIFIWLIWNRIVTYRNRR